MANFALHSTARKEAEENPILVILDSISKTKTAKNPKTTLPATSFLTNISGEDHTSRTTPSDAIQRWRSQDPINEPCCSEGRLAVGPANEGKAKKEG